MRRNRSVTVAAGVGAALWLVACNSAAPATAEAGPCNVNPRVCKAGTTCWLSDDNGDYACLPSGAAGAGEVCQNTPGIAQCADGLDCLQFSQDMPGTCVADCSLTDEALACPQGSQCRPLYVLLDGGESTQALYICTPNGPPPDGGADAGPVDAGGDEAAPPSDAGDAGETGG